MESTFNGGLGMIAALPEAQAAAAAAAVGGHIVGRSSRATGRGQVTGRIGVLISGSGTNLQALMTPLPRTTP